jgi:hypothetical protein
MNNLDWLSLQHLEGRAPNFVPPDYFRKTSFQRSNVAKAVAVNRDGFVVERRQSGRRLVEPPDLLLRKGERQRTFRDRTTSTRRCGGSGRCKGTPFLYLKQSLLSV